MPARVADEYQDVAGPFERDRCHAVHIRHQADAADTVHHGGLAELHSREPGGVHGGHPAAAQDRGVFERHTVWQLDEVAGGR